MRVRVTYNNATIQRLKQAQYKALALTAQTVHDDVVQSGVMPFDSGNMQNDNMHVDDSKIKQGKASIVVDTPYARRLYFHPEFNFNQSNNPHAKGLWFEDYVSGSKKKFVSNVFKQHYKRLAGG